MTSIYTKSFTFSFTDNQVCNETVCVANGGSYDYGTLECLNCSLLGHIGNCCSLITDCAQGNPCLNEGNCSDTNDGISCDCYDGVEGDYCQVDLNLCNTPDFDLCHNGGTCVDGLGFDYTCICTEDYNGTKCDQPVCHSNYCNGNGVCSINDNTHSCQCNPGYSGDQCEIDHLVCEDTTCHNGICHEGPGIEWTCSCPEWCDPPLSTFECSTSCNNPCDILAPCENNSTCITINMDNEENYFANFNYTCNCTFGYGGRNCSEDNFDACKESPCDNNGTCIDWKGDSYSCDCPIGFSGSKCSTDDEYCSLIGETVCGNCSDEHGAVINCSQCPQDVCNCSNKYYQPNYCQGDDISNSTYEHIEYSACHILVDEENCGALTGVLVQCPCFISPGPSPTWYQATSGSFLTSSDPTLSYFADLTSEPILGATSDSSLVCAISTTFIESNYTCTCNSASIDIDPSVTGNCSSTPPNILPVWITLVAVSWVITVIMSIIMVITILTVRYDKRKAQHQRDLNILSRKGNESFSSTEKLNTCSM